MALLAPKDRIQKAAQEYAARHGVNMHEFWDAFDEKAKLDKDRYYPDDIEGDPIRKIPLTRDNFQGVTPPPPPPSAPFDIPPYPLAPPNQVEIPARLLRSGFRQFASGIDTGYQTTDPATLLGMDPTEVGPVLGGDPIVGDLSSTFTDDILSPTIVKPTSYYPPPTDMERKEAIEQSRLDLLYKKFKDAAKEGEEGGPYDADRDYFDKSVEPTYDRDHFKAEILSIIYKDYDLIGSTYVHKLTKRQPSPDLFASMKTRVLKAYNEFLARYQEEFQLSPPHYLMLNDDELDIPPPPPPPSATAAAPSATAAAPSATAAAPSAAAAGADIDPVTDADIDPVTDAAAAKDKLKVGPSTTKEKDPRKLVLDAYNLALLPQQAKTIYEVGVDSPKFAFNALANRYMGRAAETPAMQNNINYWYPIRRGEWYLASLDLRKPEHNYAGMSQEERDKHGWAGWNMTGYGITDKAGKAAFYNKDVQEDSWNLLVKLGFMTEPPSATLQAGLHEYNLSDRAIWQSIHYGSDIDKQNQIDAARVRGGITGRGEHGKRREIGFMHFVKQWKYDQQFVSPEEKIGLAAYLSEKVGGPWAVTRQPTPPDYVTPSTYQTQPQDTLLGQDPTEPWGVDNPKIISMNPTWGTDSSDYIRRSQRGDPLGLNGEFS